MNLRGNVIGRNLFWLWVVATAAAIFNIIWLHHDATQNRTLNEYFYLRIMLYEKIIPQAEFDTVVTSYSAEHRAMESELRVLHIKQTRKRIEAHIKRVNPKADAKQIASALVECAVMYSIDPVLYAAQIHQESSYNAAAVGANGERGLAQLTKTTATELGVAWDSAFDVRVSLCAGARYFRQQLNKTGSVRQALLRYNGAEEYIEQVSYRFRSIARQ
jgi:hypothetical protein